MSCVHRNARIKAVLLAACVLLSLLPVRAQQQLSSAGDSNPAKILFTALDKNKKFVTTLRKEDIRVLEDGVPQEIADLQRRIEQPLSIVLILDVSLSQENVFPIAKQVTRQFINLIVRPEKDRVGVVSFTGEVKLEQAVTGDLEQVRQSIERLEIKLPQGYKRNMTFDEILKLPKPSEDQVTQGSSAIWDAVWLASEKLSAQATDDAHRVIIIFTDGEDTGGKHKLNETVENAIKSGVVVHSIGIGDERYGGTNKNTLRKISEKTGGRAFFPEKVKDLQAVFAAIEQELRSQYLISYSSASKKTDNKIRKVKIEIVNPELRKQGLQLSHQQGYFTKG